MALEIAEKQGYDLKQGVYFASTGPTYETPAEYKYYRLNGADAVGMALPFLKNCNSQEALNTFINRFNDSLRIAMFLVGANNIEELKQSRLVIRGKTREWLNERGINTKNYSRR